MRRQCKFTLLSAIGGLLVSGCQQTSNTDPDIIMCPQYYDPVCVTFDTGARCVQAPCPSTERVTFPNDCMMDVDDDDRPILSMVRGAYEDVD